MHCSGLRKGVFLAAGRVNDEVRILYLVVKRHLAAQPVEDFLAAGPIALHRALDLLLRAADGDDQTVVILITPRLDQYRSFGYGDAIGMFAGEFGYESLFTDLHVGMDQGVQLGELPGVGEYDRRETSAIEGAAGVENFFAESCDHGFVRFPTLL